MTFFWLTANLDDLEKVEVVYETMPGWKTSLCNIRSYQELPENAKLYVKKIEELCGVPGTPSTSLF